MTLLKIGYLSHDYKDQMDITALNKILDAIGEQAVVTEIQTSGDYGYVVHNKSVELLNILSDDEKENLWDYFSPLLRYGDVDVYPKHILDHYNGVIMTVTVEQFKEWLQGEDPYQSV